MKEETCFHVDLEKCIGCGQCTRACPGQILELDENKKPVMEDFEDFGWNGCWKCEHCLAVCPVGAISIFHHDPKESKEALKSADTQFVMDSIILNRHTCRRYQDKNVDSCMIDEML